jgi:RNA polymerase sporulation-specific sigma factor
VSRTLKERSAQIKAVRAAMIIDLNREPTIQELSDRTGLTPEDIAAAESATACTESISREIGAEGFTLENILTDTDSEEKMLERIALNQAIEKLSERERLVIKLRYFHGLTQDRVSKVLNVSQVQVSRIEKRAIANLKEFMS